MKKIATVRKAQPSEPTTPPAVYHIPHEHFIVALSFLVIALAGVVFTQSSAEAAKAPAKTSVTVSCSDPDDLNVTTKATVTRTQINNKTKKATVTKKTDACVSKTVVREYACSKTNTITSKVIVCPSGTKCQKGACAEGANILAEVVVPPPPPPSTLSATTWCKSTERSCQDSTGANLTAACNGDERQYTECVDGGFGSGWNGKTDEYGNAISEGDGHCVLRKVDCKANNNHTCRINDTTKLANCAFRDEPVAPPKTVSTSTAPGNSSILYLPNKKMEATDGSWCTVMENTNSPRSCTDSRGVAIADMCVNNNSRLAFCGGDDYKGRDLNGNGIYGHFRCVYIGYDCASFNNICAMNSSGEQASCYEARTTTNTVSSTPSSTTP